MMSIGAADVLDVFSSVSKVAVLLYSGAKRFR
jgi:hypothetical protein